MYTQKICLMDTNKTDQLCCMPKVIMRKSFLMSVKLISLEIEPVAAVNNKLDFFTECTIKIVYLL